MKLVEFKMERLGLVEIGQEIEITAHDALSGTCYIIEPSVAMSGCFRGRDRIRSSRGIVREIKHTDRGYYIVAEFDE